MSSSYHASSSIFQSTLPARGATGKTRRVPLTACISIHAPRTGSDVQGYLTIGSYLNISIHAPRTGSDSRG